MFGRGKGDRLALQAVYGDMQFMWDSVKTAENPQKGTVIIDGSYVSPSERAMPNGSYIWSLDDAKVWEDYTELLEKSIEAFNERTDVGTLYWSEGMLMYDPLTWQDGLVSLEGDAAVNYLYWAFKSLYPCRCATTEQHNCSVNG